MPKLSSGRDFALIAPYFAENIKELSNEEAYLLILRLRLEIPSPKELLSYLSIEYFDPEDKGPPHGRTIPSGYLVRDLALGNTDWSSHEITEFNSWQMENSALNQWLIEKYSEINEAIRNSPLWNSELILGD